MDSYKDLYFHLFAALADAMEYMERGNTILAYECLTRAQRETEEACLRQDVLPDI